MTVELHNHNFSQIVLKLGEKCNLSCIYCKRDGAMFAPEIQDKPISRSVMVTLANMLKKNHGLEVRFWAGEPFLYFDEMVNILMELRSMVGRNFRAVTITNGTQFTAERVHKINTILQPFTIAISNDGGASNITRGFNALEDKELVKLLKTCKHWYISSVLTKYTQDLYSMFDFILDKLGYIPWYFFQFLYISEDTPPELYDFDIPALRATFDRMVEDVKRKNQKYRTLINGVVKKEMRRAVGKRKWCCSQMQTLLTTDVEGTVYGCHNKGYPIGHLWTPYHDLKQAFFDTHKDLGDCHCEECGDMCHGICPYTPIDKVKYAKWCAARREYMEFIRKIVALPDDCIQWLFPLREDAGITKNPVRVPLVDIRAGEVSK